MFRKGIILFIICMFVVGFFCHYYDRWKYLWAVAIPEQHYSVLKVQDDTLRLLMIGDSWAGIHSELNMDSFLSSKLEQKAHRPRCVLFNPIGTHHTKYKRWDAIE